MADGTDGGETVPHGGVQPRAGRLLELALFVPLGALDLAWRELPALARRRRTQVEQQVRTARWLGEMAVRMGQTKLSAEFDARRRRATRGTVAERRSAQDGSASTDPATTVAGLHLVEPSAAEPFPGYDALPAVDLVPLLGRLSRAELEVVRHYEAAMRNRRTVLARVEQLLAA
ncbi:MAG: hypothetical protein ACO3S5_11890 [Ilumatobacteraceae bacterium]